MNNPKLFYCGQFDSQQGSYPTVETEITLRDLFAAFAMIGLISNPREDFAATTREEKAVEAGRQADAMLAERAKSREEEV